MLFSGKSNLVKRVYLLVIELAHPIFGFEQTDVEHNVENWFWYPVEVL